MQIIFWANGCFKADYYQDAIAYEHQNKNYDQETFGRRYFDQTTSVMRDEVEKLVETPSQIA